jgi:hypothetical protein
VKAVLKIKLLRAVNRDKGNGIRLFIIINEKDSQKADYNI